MSHTVVSEQNLELLIKSKIRDIPDFPKPGIVFKDITPLLRDPDAFLKTIQHMAAPYQDQSIDAVVGIESRGFIIGAPVAYALNAGFIPVRKQGKLPHDTHRAEYDLEYGQDAVEIHKDAVMAGQKILLVDDLLATGGTACATIQLLNQLGADVVAACFIIELTFLNGREKLTSCKTRSLIRY